MHNDEQPYTEREEEWPKVFCEDVANWLRPIVDSDDSERIDVLVERAQCGASTFWRVLRCDSEYLTLDRADKLMVAIGRSVNDCRILHENGCIEVPDV